MFTVDNKVIEGEAPVAAADGTQFPAGFFTEAELKARHPEIIEPVITYPDSHFYDWVHNADGTITITPKDLDVCKAYVRGLIAAERDRRILTGGYPVMVGGAEKWFHSDVFSRSQHLGLDNLATKAVLSGKTPDYILQDAEGHDIAWKTMDGTFTALTVDLAFNIFRSGINQDNSTFKNCAMHQAVIDSKMEVPSVEVYDYSDGWPRVFQDTQTSI